MNNGWVKLHRQLFSNDLWLSEPFTKAQAWIDLFANANHEDGSFWVRGNEVKLLRGQIGWSELTMSKRWRWSKNKTRRYLKWLETEQQIVQQKYLYITTIITIINYDKFQETEQQTIQQKDSRRYINKNDKKKKNDKNINTGGESPPQVSKVIDLFKVVNPYYQNLFKNKTERDACERLLKVKPLEELERIINFLPTSNATAYMPTITTPYQLESKMGQLAASWQKIKNKENSKPITL